MSGAVGVPPKVPVYRPYLGVEVQEAARKALEVGWLGMGALTREFEQALEARLLLDGRRAVSTNSCTEALHIAARLIGLGPGDEVICPSFTYVAGHQAISRTGASIVFCDVEPDNLSIDPARVRELITDRTRAVLAVDYLGIPCQLDELMDIAREHDLRVLEDAAHAFGSSSKGRPVGSFGDITCFSFGPVKTITTLEGGAVITPDERDVQALHELRHLGIDADTDARYRNQRNWDFDVVRQGYRCHLGSVPAAIGLAQLAMVDEFVLNRQTYCRTYDQAFADIEGLRLFDTDWKDIAPYIYVLRVADGRRADLAAHLSARGVSTGIHFLGAHEFSFYADSRRGDLSVTEQAAGEVLTLPLHPYMTPEVLEQVIDGVRSFYAAG
ncbi:aminotransferase class I/II-fold pyridoxal phosphate-dependent enzyme [Modestobacter sp. I12A-02628]|uniref:DegT/DnrJ/EryC1/StrS family aminotransferase n=1 Tax=Goekera deserti TaxID=2497753 RepID=A0A7K3W7L3_9ACTN|nr:DegT/DnrJ/EryC1/StrS family aminotransferase [Goekera deserti]MPQ99910.1 aminotransferase class I/II-fold pyridoxal phosphate-dependent enzyme [Goekera deserti]NDI50069.1 aminotransferase class I/II-fold pyridoxal phosphate-dependent enzyme [Goekera deserti]NEL52455.1 DegT/DnrJ/EryC1/StrS family aminotransferase [Goekera deserti]